MDAFAHYRRSLGLSAVSINAGLVSDPDHTIAGTEMESYLERFSHMAAVSTNLEQLDIGITAALRGSTTDGSEVPPQFVFGINDILRREDPVVDQWTRDAKFNHRVALKSEAKLDETVDAGPNVSDLLQSAASLTEAAQVVQDALKRWLAPDLGVQTTDINPKRPLYDMGGKSRRFCSPFLVSSHVFSILTRAHTGLLQSRGDTQSGLSRVKERHFCIRDPEP
ncbi:hypothetical protein GGS24DRAFT_262810 [Hypoxylon argillaceum]|nr:hypothetical protein GGS24DRAFT_262810 [Hypoxylon argillaceum]